jgi:hypothetical protein
MRLEKMIPHDTKLRMNNMVMDGDARRLLPLIRQRRIRKTRSKREKAATERSSTREQRMTQSQGR